jgi:hypothetical protein
MQVKPGVAYISDIAVHHAEVLYGKGTPTVAALCDLAEICQAAVLNETLAVSPAAYHGSTLLPQLDFVEDPTPKVTESSSDPAPAIGGAKDEIVIDVDEAGELTSSNPIGLLYLAHLAAELLQDGPILGPLANPKQIPADMDRGLFFIDKLPVFIFLLQAKKGAANFESEASRQYLLERTNPDLSAYRKYARRILALQESFGMQPTFSCLEQAIGDEIMITRAIGTVETNSFWEQFRTRLSDAIVKDRSEFFEKWTVPPLGLMVLGRAKKLDDLPAEIAKLRDGFLKVRNELIKLEEEKQAALSDGLDDRRYREVTAIDQKINKAFEAFDAALAEHRRSAEIKRTEFVFNMPRYVSWLMSFGIGSLNQIIEVANLKRLNYLTKVKGLYKALWFIKQSDDRYIVDIAERFLGRPHMSFALHADMLRFAAEKIEKYSHSADNATTDDDTFRIETRTIPHSQIWSQMIKEEPLRRLLLHPLKDEESAARSA